MAKAADEQLAQNLNMAWIRSSGLVSSIPDADKEREAWLAVAQKAKEILSK